LATALLIALGPQITPAYADNTGDPRGSSLSELLPGLTREELDRLIASGELAYAIESGAEPSVRLAPSFAAEILADIQSLEPTIGVEVLFLADAPEGAAPNGAAPNGARRIDAELMTTLHAVGTMAGIEYYSASRGRMRTLFHESFIVDSPEDLRPRPDPVIESVESSSRIYVYQRDSSFGRNVLEVTYTVDGDAVRMRMRNLTRMNYQGIVPAVGENDLVLNIVVHLLGERLLFYGNSAARPTSLFGMEARVQESFQNRLVAIYRWFLNNV
jgi:hypothetical protein